MYLTNEPERTGEGRYGRVQVAISRCSCWGGGGGGGGLKKCGEKEKIKKDVNKEHIAQFAVALSGE